MFFTVVLLAFLVVLWVLSTERGARWSAALSRLLDRWGRRGRALALVTSGAVLAGGLIALRALLLPQLIPGPDLQMRNPIPPTTQSLAIGGRIYQRHCQSCHGADGSGNGPAGARLNPRPVDFRIHMAMGHPDGLLFYWVSNGMAGTAMPPFRDRLSGEERWHVINFIKTFAPVAR